MKEFLMPILLLILFVSLLAGADAAGSKSQKFQNPVEKIRAYLKY